MLYGPNNWYDGEWFEGKRQGFGIRRYLSGAVYEGMWRNNVQNGEGSMAWENSDVKVIKRSDFSKLYVWFAVLFRKLEKRGSAWLW